MDGDEKLSRESIGKIVLKWNKKIMKEEQEEHKDTV